VLKLSYLPQTEAVDVATRELIAYELAWKPRLLVALLNARP
jgi:hypothetical protein